jgi:hypothetical protein
MTPAEVLAAFPGEAQQLGQPTSFGPGASGSAEVTIPAYASEDTRFRVLFGFAAGGLSRVQLAAAKAEPETCDAIEKRLAGEHGQPSSRNETATSVQTKEVAWRLPAQTITLTCTDKPSLGFRTVTLDYVVAGTAPTN